MKKTSARTSAFNYHGTLNYANKKKRTRIVLSTTETKIVMKNCSRVLVLGFLSFCSEGNFNSSVRHVVTAVPTTLFMSEYGNRYLKKAATKPTEATESDDYGTTGGNGTAYNDDMPIGSIYLWMWVPIFFLGCYILRLSIISYCNSDAHSQWLPCVPWSRCYSKSVNASKCGTSAARRKGNEENSNGLSSPIKSTEMKVISKCETKV